MRRTAHLLLLALLLAACGGWRGGDRLMSRADSLMYARPAAALVLLDSIPEAARARMSKGQRMRYELLRADAQNKNFVKFTTDSVLKAVVSYYDSHGTPNERMRANYLLGRAYYDMGETPLALKYYHEAADCADTTQIDCDYKLLSRVHGQMGSLFLDCCAPQNARDEFQNARFYAAKVNDTLSWISCFNKISSAFEYMNMPDSALYYTLQACELYQKYGLKDLACMSKGSVIDILIKQRRFSEAQSAIKEYESVPGLFDSNNSIQEGKEIFYYSKGLYYQETQNYDSAQYYYRKLVNNAKDANHYECGYKGLSEVCRLMGKTDSALYYSRLAYNFNDSSQLQNSTAEYQHNQAVYNFSRSQQLADRREKEARTNKENLRGALAITIILILLLIVILMWAYNKLGKIHRLKKEVSKCYVSLLQSKFELSGLLDEAGAQKGFHEDERTSLSLLDIDDVSGSEDLRNSLKEVIQKLEETVVEKEKNLQERIREIQLTVKKQEEELERFRDNSSLKDRIHFESLLTDNPTVHRFKEMCVRHETPAIEEWAELRKHLERQIPSFVPIICGGKQPISTDEIKVCMLIRLHFTLPEIKYLINKDSANLTTMRSRLIKKIYGIEEGGAPDFDKMIMSIC